MDHAEFVLVRSFLGAALSYPGGRSVAVSPDDTDFQQLKREGCITLRRNRQGLFYGKPTKRGVDFARQPAGGKPHLSLSVHASIAEIEDQGRRLLRGCSNVAANGQRLSFNMEKATEILRTCASEVFDKQAEYLLSIEGYRQEWLAETFDRTLFSTLELVDPLDLLVDSAPEMRSGVRRTLLASLEKRKKRPASTPANESGDAPTKVASPQTIRETPPAELKNETRTKVLPSFPKRAAWLAERLHERSWNKHDLSRERGPDHKTVQKILDGLAVREDVLDKVANGLSAKKGKVNVVDIPQN